MARKATMEGSLASSESGLIYEYFHPTSELIEAKEADTLVLNLPGFKKDQVKVENISTKKKFKISGKRLVTYKKCSHFLTYVPISSKYDFLAVSFKFESGKLYFKLPKSTVPTEALPKEETPQPVEDFDPSRKWTHQNEGDMLILNLPEFKKVQLQVTTSLEKMLLCISGVRQVSDNTWSRFHMKLPIPSNYDATIISAMFEKGTLYFKCPKLIVSEELTTSEAPMFTIPPLQNALPPPQEEALKIPPVEVNSKPPQCEEEATTSKAPICNIPSQQSLLPPPEEEEEAPKKPPTMTASEPPQRQEGPSTSGSPMLNIPSEQNALPLPQEEAPKTPPVQTAMMSPQQEGTKPPEQPFGTQEESIILEAPPQQNPVGPPQEEAPKKIPVETAPKPSQSEEISSSSSKSTSAPRFKYDVFLSFRGADTRRSFMSHLSNALKRSQIIDPFIDEKLDKGEDISPTLLEKIEESCIALIIFSKNYANSEWCLDELAKIVECKNKIGQIVLPVFYKIDPTHVQELSGSFGDAFRKHKGAYKQNLDKVNKWRNAVVETSNLNGWDSRNFKFDSELIDKIVDDILKKRMSSSVFDEDGLVGIDARIQEIETLLSLDKSNDVLFLGISGMGGVGKTTIAATIYGRKLSEFEGHYFLRNVREQLEKRTLIDLRDEILYEILGQKNLKSGRTPNLPSFVISRLRRKKVIIVLDDVTTLEQIETLVGKHSQYGQGSRIIITSRNSQLLKGCDNIYDLKSLTNDEAGLLFKLHAFKKGKPEKEHLELIRKAIKYAQGSPLVLKVLGSNLSGKPIKEWESQLEKLSTIPINEVDRILRISFDGLDDYERKIFLDIACCFKGWNKDIAERILDGCGFSAIIGIQNLIEKSLIHVEGNKLVMHDLLQQMGKKIIYEANSGLVNMSRMWNPKQICPLLEGKRVNSAVEVISLDISEIDKDELVISSTAFMKMDNLRLLILQNSVPGKCKIRLPHGLEHLSNELRLLHWDGFPLKSLPSNFCPDNLVELHLCHSQVEKLWDKSIKPLKNLKCIDLKHSINLVEIPEFSQVPNLIDLYLQGCTNLREIPSSIGCNRKLVHVSLIDCKSLTTLPNFNHLKTLESLSLHGCKKITYFPKVPPTIKRLSLRGTQIEEMPPFVKNLIQLEQLDLGFCRRLASLPSNIDALKSLKCLFLWKSSKLMSISNNICNLKSLEDLNLGGCIKVDQLPENLGNLESLSFLFIPGTGIKTLPSSINNLSKLKVLSCGECKGLLLPTLTGLTSLEELYLNDCGFSEFPDGICQLVSLRLLDLGGNNFNVIPESIKQLSRLQILYLRGCERLCHFPMPTPFLEYLDACNCTSLRSIEGQEQRLVTLFSNFGNCHSLDMHVLRCLSTSTFDMMAFASLYLQEAKMDSDELYDENETDRNRVLWGASFCVPGNEINPDACSFQNTGSSLVVDDLGDECKILKGCTFWAVVHRSGLYDSHGVDVRCDVHLTSDSTDPADCFDFHSTFLSNRTPILEDATPVLLQSKHVFSWYNTFFGSMLPSFASGEFKFELMDGNKNSSGSPCGVIKCGVTLLFATSDNQLFAPPRHFEGNTQMTLIRAFLQSIKEERT